jgi:hypothetical protein
LKTTSASPLPPLFCAGWGEVNLPVPIWISGFGGS